MIAARCSAGASRSSKKAPAILGGGFFIFRLIRAVHSVVANALVVAVPPVGTASGYSIAIEPSAAATVAVSAVWQAIPAIMAVAIVTAFVGVMLATATAVVMPATVMTAAATAIVMPATVMTAAATVATTVTAAVMTATAAAATVATTVTAAVMTAATTDKRYNTESCIAFQCRQRGCLCRGRYKTSCE